MEDGYWMQSKRNLSSARWLAGRATYRDENLYQTVITGGYNKQNGSLNTGEFWQNSDWLVSNRTSSQNSLALLVFYQSNLSHSHRRKTKWSSDFCQNAFVRRTSRSFVWRTSTGFRTSESRVCEDQEKCVEQGVRRQWRRWRRGVQRHRGRGLWRTTVSEIGWNSGRRRECMETGSR